MREEFLVVLYSMYRRTGKTTDRHSVRVIFIFILLHNGHGSSCPFCVFSQILSQPGTLPRRVAVPCRHSKALLSPFPHIRPKKIKKKTLKERQRRYIQRAKEKYILGRAWPAILFSHDLPLSLFLLGRNRIHATDLSAPQESQGRLGRSAASEHVPDPKRPSGVPIHTPFNLLPQPPSLGTQALHLATKWYRGCLSPLSHQQHSLDSILWILSQRYDTIVACPDKNW